MSEVVVSPNSIETVITLGDGTVVSETVSKENLVVMSQQGQTVVIDLNSGARGEPGSAILVGDSFPLMSQGSVGDIFLATSGVNVGAVFKKTDTAWVEQGNVRGPAGGIESVNGDFGPGVILDPQDIGLGEVDNTADIDKPVSGPQQAALDLKANESDVVDLTSAQTIAGAKTFSSAPLVPDNSWAITKTAGLQAALDAKSTIASDETITGIKTFTVAPVVPDNSFAQAKVTGLVSALAGKESSIAAGTAAQYWRGDKTWQTLNKSAVGLANVDNTSDANKPVSTAQQSALDLKANLASPTFTGTVSGITAAMVGLGNVANTAQVDLVNAQTIAGIKTFSASPIVPTPTTANQATNKTYVDSAISGLVNGAAATLDTLNELAAAIGNDANFATTVTNSIATKEPAIAAPTAPTTKYWRGDKTWVVLDKTAVGLANVDNTSDANKPVSSAQQTALNLKANLASPTFTGTVSGITASMVGLGNVANTAQVDLVNAQSIAGIKTFTATPVFSAGISVTGTVAATTLTGAYNAASLTGTVPQNVLVVNTVRVVHGSTASTARPTGATYVEWIGSVQPTNMGANDTWVNTSSSGNSADMFPTGMVVASASVKTTAPSGWYFAEGQEILISGDTALYNELTNNGTTFTAYGANTNGAGAAGSTHFRLPNLKGKTIFHADATTEFATIGLTGGGKSFTLAANNLPPHTHSITDPTHRHQMGGFSSTWTWNANNTDGGTTEDIYMSGPQAAAAPGGQAPGNELVTRSSEWNYTRYISTGITGTNNNTTTNASVAMLNPYMALRYMIKR